MGRKRAAVQRQNGLRIRGEAYSAASAIASSLADPRTDSVDTSVAVLPKCVQLLAMLSTDVVLAHYIAQGFPTLIHRLLPYAVACRAENDGSEDDTPQLGAPDASSQMPVLLLCALLVRCGAPMSDVGPAVEKQADALVTLIATATSPVASVALVLLRTAVGESEHAPTVAARLLVADSPLWESIKAVEGRAMEAGASNADGGVAALPLSTMVHLVRLCVASAGPGLGVNAGAEVVAWVESLPFDAIDGLASEQRRALEDASLLLLATLRVLWTDLSEPITDALTKTGLAKLVTEAAASDDDACVPSTSLAIAATFYTHAAMPSGLLQDMYQCVGELRERDFDADKRVASVRRMGSVLATIADVHGSVYACAALYYLPGAMHALYGAACDVEVATSACAYRVLAAMVKPVTVTSPELCPGAIPLAFFQNELAEELVRLGCILTLEDALSDYNADVVSAALALTLSLLSQLPQARAAVLSSLCLQRVAHLFQAVADREDVQTYMTEAAHQQVFAAAFEVLLTLTTAELATLPEEMVANVSTVTTFCRDDLTVLSRGLEVLSRFAAAHPYATTLIVDYDFLTEQLQTPDEPEGAEGCLVRGTLNIMTAMAEHVPSAVSLEWIELLLLCFNRLEGWETTSTAFKLAAWRCLRETLLVSEDSREYIFEGELTAWVVKALGEEKDAQVLREMLRSSLYVPFEMTGLVDAILDGIVVKRCMKGSLVVGDAAASADDVQRILLDCVALVTSRSEETRVAPQLFRCLAAIAKCAASWPLFVPHLLAPLQDCFIACWGSLVPPVVTYVRDTFHLNDATEAAHEGEVPHDQATAVILLDALGTAAPASIGSCSPATRHACASLGSDLVRAHAQLPVKASLAGLFLLLHALAAPESPELATSLLEDGGFFEAMQALAEQHVGVERRDNTDAQLTSNSSPDSASGLVADTLEAQVCEALYQTSGRLVQALPYERQQKLGDDGPLISFLSKCALRDVAKSYACGDLLMHVLTSQAVREVFGVTARSAYRDALAAMENQRGAGPLKFVLESYKAELD